MEGKLIQFRHYKVWRSRVTSKYTIHDTNTDDTCSSCVQHDVHDHAMSEPTGHLSPSEDVNKLSGFKPGLL